MGMIWTRQELVGVGGARNISGAFTLLHPLWITELLLNPYYCLISTCKKNPVTILYAAGFCNLTDGGVKLGTVLKFVLDRTPLPSRRIRYLIPFK